MPEISATSSGLERVFRQMEEQRKSEFQAAPPARYGPGLPTLTPEQQDRITTEVIAAIRHGDFAPVDVSAMPVTTAPAPSTDDGKLHFKKQSDPGY